MTVTIAQLAAEDVEAARALALLADVPTGSAEQWARDLRSTSKVVLGAHAPDGRLLGIATGEVAVDDADVHLVAVDPEHRRRGIGRELTRALCRTLAALGAQRVLLEVRAANDAALGLYTELGFTELARRRSYYRDGEDAVVLAKDTPPLPLPGV